MENIVEKLHSASIRILEELGMEFQNKEICDLMAKNGVRVEGQRAFFTEKQIYKYLAMTKKEFTIKARNEKFDMHISDKTMNFSPGFGCAKITEKDGKQRVALLDDYIRFAKLTHESPVFKINGGILAQPNDVNASNSNQIMLYSSMKLSDKCIFGIAGSKKSVENIVNMIKIVFEDENDLQNNYRVITLISPLSPLMIDINMLSSLYIMASNNQPVIIAPGCIAGATGPISLSGNIAMANAEFLACMALTQIINPGNPVVYGFAATVSDMATMNVSIGSPGFLKQAKYGSMLAEKYGLPKRSAGPLTDAKAVTAQAGVESAMGLFETFSQNGNFVMHSAGILDSFSTMSYEKFVLDIETISRMQYYFSELEVNDETLAMDVIRDVIRGKNFISHSHTFKRIRKDPWIPSVSKNKKLTKDANEMFVDQLRQNAESIIEKYKKPELSLKKLDDYMISIGIDKSILDKIN